MRTTIEHLRTERTKALERLAREPDGGLFTANLRKPYWAGVAEGLRVAIETLENE